MATRTSVKRLLAAVVAGTALACPATMVLAAPAWEAGSQPGQNAASGRRIEARDGDLIVVRDDARVRIVRRREAAVRAIYNAEQQWLVLLVDYVAPNGPDGLVETSYTFNGIHGTWPLEERWEGSAVVEDYAIAGETGPTGFGLVTPQGLVQILSPVSERVYRDDRALAVLSSNGHGRGGGSGQPFEVVERQQISTAIRNAAAQGGRQLGPPGFSTRSSLDAAESVSGVVTAAGLAPVRVGGTIRPPVKLVDVPAVMPDEARAANIRGVVILELVIGTDGTVRSARVLRSIPLLDEAALAAARQWRYEPTLLNDQPVPVIMTVTVSFQ